MAGSGLHIVALGWYLLDRTGSATSVALVWALGLGSGIVMLPFAGPLADRYPRRTLAIKNRPRALRACGGDGGPRVRRLAVAPRPLRADVRGRPRPQRLLAVDHRAAPGGDPPRAADRRERAGRDHVAGREPDRRGARRPDPRSVRAGSGIRDRRRGTPPRPRPPRSSRCTIARRRPRAGTESGLAMAREGVDYLRRHRAIAGFGIDAAWDKSLPPAACSPAESPDRFSGRRESRRPAELPPSQKKFPGQYRDGSTAKRCMGRRAGPR